MSLGEVRFRDPVGRQVEDGRRVDGHLEQGPEVAELETAVDQNGPLVRLAEGDRQVERDRRLADTALRREDGIDARRARRRQLGEVLPDLADPIHQVEAGERHREHAVNAPRGVDLDRVLGDGEDDHRDAVPGARDLLGERQALDPALQEGVDEDDVGTKLLDVGQHLRAVAQDVEQLDRALGVEQAADVLGHLRHVLDDEEARLVTRCHRRRVYQAAVGSLLTRRSGPRRLPRPVRAWSRLPGDEDRALAAWADRIEIVGSGDVFDDETGVGRECP
jgi:hypothetical protein